MFAHSSTKPFAVLYLLHEDLILGWTCLSSVNSKINGSWRLSGAAEILVVTFGSLKPFGG